MSELHIFERTDPGFEFCVWLDTEVAEEDGLCIGVGRTRAQALHAAELDLLAALDAVRAERTKEGVTQFTEGTMRTVRAKFTVTDIQPLDGNNDGKTVVLTPQYDQAIPEDQRFYQATPTGRFEMTIDNPPALEVLTLGRAFYIDLTPMADQETVPV